MSGTLGNYFGNLMLASLHANGAYLSLHLSDPTPTGNPATEYPGVGYHRQLVTWSSPAAKTTATTAGVTFNGIPGAAIPYVGAWDSFVGGNFLVAWLLVTPLVFGTTGIIFAAAGDFAVALP